VLPDRLLEAGVIDITTLQALAEALVRSGNHSQGAPPVPGRPRGSSADNWINEN